MIPRRAQTPPGCRHLDDRHRRKLSARAGRVDLALTDDPDVHLRADGVRLDAEEIEARIWRFRLPGPVADLRIVSRSAIPSMLGTEQDQRRLGVALRRIVLAQPGLRREVGWDRRAPRRSDRPLEHRLPAPCRPARACPRRDHPR